MTNGRPIDGKHWCYPAFGRAHLEAHNASNALDGAIPCGDWCDDKGVVINGRSTCRTCPYASISWSVFDPNYNPASVVWRVAFRDWSFTVERIGNDPVVSCWKQQREPEFLDPIEQPIYSASGAING